MKVMNTMGEFQEDKQPNILGVVSDFSLGNESK